MRFICEFRNGYTPSKNNPSFWENGNIPWYRMEDIRKSGRKLDKAIQYITKKAVTKGLFEAGSFILATTATIGEHALLIVDSLANQRFTNLKIRKSLKNSISNDYFFFYLFVVDEYCKSTTNTSTFPAVNMEDLKNVAVVIPPIEEQVKIVSYLEKYLQNIDLAIAQQQRMIELLQERKQIIINHTVTKGLNKNTKLKDSGIDWIGKIPENWEVRRLRFLCKIKTGDKDTINRVDNGKYPFYVRSPHIERINSYSYDGEAILMAGDGVGAGKVFHYANGKFDYHQRVYNLHDIKEIKAKLLYYYMRTLFTHTIEQLSAKSTVDSVRLNMLQDFVVVIPPQKEQLKMLDFIKKNEQKLDSAISTCQHQISLLTERKQIIINEVVTGKVKVI